MTGSADSTASPSCRKPPARAARGIIDLHHFHRTDRQSVSPPFCEAERDSQNCRSCLGLTRAVPLQKPSDSGAAGVLRLPPSKVPWARAANVSMMDSAS